MVEVFKNLFRKCSLIGKKKHTLFVYYERNSRVSKKKNSWAYLVLTLHKKNEVYKKNSNLFFVGILKIQNSM